MPIVVIASAIAVSGAGKNALISGLFTVIAIVFVTLTGERINTLILVSAALLAGAIWQPNWRRYGTLLIATFLLFATLFHFYPELSSRFIEQVLSIPTVNIAHITEQWCRGS